MPDPPSAPAQVAASRSAEPRAYPIRSAADLGRAIRRRRKRLGHTQAETAALSGVGVRFLSELERGKPTVELDRALLVARRLGLRVHVSSREGDAFLDVQE